jgi:hypothetical protein
MEDPCPTGSAEDRALRSVASDFTKAWPFATSAREWAIGIDAELLSERRRSANLGQNEEGIAAAIMGAHEASWPLIQTFEPFFRYCSGTAVSIGRIRRRTGSDRETS